MKIFLFILFFMTNAYAVTPDTCLDPTLLGMSPSASGTVNRNALNTAIGQSNSICIPPGTYQISDSINIFVSNRVIRGAGRNLTILQTSSWGSTSSFISMLDASDNIISDLTIDFGSISSPTTFGCIIIAGSPRVSILRIGCINSANGGVSFQQNGGGTGSPNGLLANSYFNNMLQTFGNSHTVEISFSDRVIISNNVMENVDNGINNAFSIYSVIVGNTINGNGANIGFAGVRCSNQSEHVSVTGNTIVNTSRGLFILGCSNSSFTGNTITNTQSQGILINATNIGGSAFPTQFNTVTGNTITQACLAGGGACDGAAIELSVSGVATTNVSGNIVVGNAIRDITGAISVGIIVTGGIAPGTNTCANNTANVTLGSC